MVLPEFPDRVVLLFIFNPQLVLEHLLLLRIGLAYACLRLQLQLAALLALVLHFNLKF